MITYLKGELTAKNPAYVVVECHGIGYFVNISLNTFSRIQNHASCKLLTYLHVREDAFVLYGFAEEAERALFLELISVQGIGPNTARMILSASNVNDLRDAIISGNESLIQSFKGIGPKTAKRLIVELREPLSKSVISQGENYLPGLHNTIREEALSALSMLGFSRLQSEKAVAQAVKANPSLDNVESVIKAALKNL